MTSIPTAPTTVLTTDEAAALPTDQVLEQVGSTAGGLSTAEAARRLARVGPNAVRTHPTSAWTILARQFRNAVLILLLITAVISFVLGDHTDAVTIGAPSPSPRSGSGSSYPNPRWPNCSASPTCRSACYWPSAG
jgi:P-type Mg2+ transporter